ncbi:MAG: hypothetical protein ACI9VR_005016, partial [Cognaticolwellia sp.]
MLCERFVLVVLGSANSLSDGVPGAAPSRADGRADVASSDNGDVHDEGPTCRGVAGSGA